MALNSSIYHSVHTSGGKAKASSFTRKSPSTNRRAFVEKKPKSKIPSLRDIDGR